MFFFVLLLLLLHAFPISLHFGIGCLLGMTVMLLQELAEVFIVLAAVLLLRLTLLLP